MADSLYTYTGGCEEFRVSFGESDAGSRLDSAISEHLPEISRSRAQTLIENGAVRLESGGESSVVMKKNCIVKPGDTARIISRIRVPLKAEPEDIPLNIVYEDDDVIVIDKPKGLVVHPAPGNESGTLVNALMFRANERGRAMPVINGEIRPGIVHRIDKNTSGLIVVCASDRAHHSLSEQFAEHSVTRAYTAIAVGAMPSDEGVIDAPIGRDPLRRKRQKALDEATSGLPTGFRTAVTHWRVLERLRWHTLLELRLETGRTHQIRVHLAHIGRPVLGDDLYGPARTAAANKKKDESQYLHAGTLGFAHPSTGEYMEFKSPLPQGFSEKLEKLRKLGGR
ncbi:MAG: RluA family pseudouridine synthase [Clostridiales Family XIII bacterium]|jgi:23S rRNA pseudouridine1911/1915/1917 synthase|nr:RluA family pseudouridine synthase [Clostridiales Family XIII bacterium]